MKAVKEMLRTLLGRKQENLAGRAIEEADAERQRITKELEERLHAVATRVHVLEWQVPPHREGPRER